MCPALSGAWPADGGPWVGQCTMAIMRAPKSRDHHRRPVQTHRTFCSLGLQGREPIGAVMPSQEYAHVPMALPSVTPSTPGTGLKALPVLNTYGRPQQPSLDAQQGSTLSKFKWRIAKSRPSWCRHRPRPCRGALERPAQGASFAPGAWENGDLHLSHRGGKPDKCLLVR